jgi:rhodanese-related sulfurtransferase
MRLNKVIYIFIFLILTGLPGYANEPKTDDFDAYLKNFDNRERRNMKIRIPELIELHRRNRVQIIDIRTAEEYSAYHLDSIPHIPVDEFPDRLGELDRSKIIVPVCSVYVRAAIIRTYLTLKGFDARYLVDGMIGLSQYLKRPGASDSFNVGLSNR